MLGVTQLHALSLILCLECHVMEDLLPAVQFLNQDVLNGSWTGWRWNMTNKVDWPFRLGQLKASQKYMAVTQVRICPLLQEP
ncbi:hypothetical protein M758_4G265800 [Ceratodon purpureus]|nr:hypothetical protein M758_4G265800 [Ceratodon purpureus]